MAAAITSSPTHPVMSDASTLFGGGHTLEIDSARRELTDLLGGESQSEKIGAT